MALRCVLRHENTMNSISGILIFVEHSRLGQRQKTKSNNSYPNQEAFSRGRDSQRASDLNGFGVTAEITAPFNSSAPSA